MSLIGKRNIENAYSARLLFVVFPVGDDCNYIRMLGFKSIRNITDHQYFILDYKDVINLRTFTDNRSLIGEVTDIRLSRKDIEKNN